MPGLARCALATRALAAAAGFAVAVPAVAAAPPGRNADWPCVQRLVPEIAASSLWSGPALPAEADWRADKAVADLVVTVTPRGVPAEEGERLIAAFADGVPADQRAQKFAALLAGLLETTNGQRSELFTRITLLGHRQRELADMIGKVTEEVRAIPDAATGADADHRVEASDRRAYLIRQFEDTQRTMRFACEVPTQLEARLGRYARVLEGKL